MSQHEHHVVPVKTYVAVFIGLMVLLALTVTAAYIDFGVFNIPITLIIAFSKASLIIGFFMHLRYSKSLVWIFGVVGFFWFIIMIVITMADYIARGTITGPIS